MVELLRLDDRLLHGQVAYTWSKALPFNLIVIANDEVTENAAQRNAFALAKPEGMKLVVSTVEKTAAFLSSEKAKRYSVLLLVNNFEDAKTLIERSGTIKELNVGGLREHEGSRRVTNAVCLSDHDCVLCRDLIAQGVEVYAQQVPADTRVNLASAVKKH